MSCEVSQNDEKPALKLGKEGMADRRQQWRTPLAQNWHRQEGECCHMGHGSEKWLGHEDTNFINRWTCWWFVNGQAVRKWASLPSEVTWGRHVFGRDRLPSVLPLKVSCCPLQCFYLTTWIKASLPWVERFEIMSPNSAAFNLFVWGIL